MGMTKLSSVAQVVQQELVRVIIANTAQLNGTLVVVRASVSESFECTFTVQVGFSMDNERKRLIRNLITKQDGFKEWLRVCLDRRLKWQDVKLKACPSQSSGTKYIWLFSKKS